MLVEKCDDFEMHSTELDGCFRIKPNKKNDERGFFIKTFKKSMFYQNLDVSWDEQYYTYSKPGVLRGLHFQTPPYHHSKLIHVIEGSIFDVVVDLRANSSTYGRAIFFELSSSHPEMVFIQSGFAHGFCTLDKPAIVCYNVTSIYNPKYDTGIKWNSIDLEWPINDPIISARDLNFVDFVNFDSPFTEIVH